ncbi:MAG: hypothetical protein HYV15_07075, partial [Elusimicrobia bacterium]|nr:hypothetical protein [Elusimicrobiota bacterium]
DIQVGVAGGLNWSFNTASVDWASRGDQRYYARLRTRDAAVSGTGADLRNTSVYMSTISFVVDDSQPVSSVTWPVDGRFFNAISSITGTANGDLAAISRIEVRLERFAGASVADWTGSSWTALNTHWFPVSGSGSGVVTWSTTTFIAPAFANDQKFRVHVKVTDRAGNQRVSGAGGDVAFTFDNQPPALDMQFPYPPPNHDHYANGSNANLEWEL